MFFWGDWTFILIIPAMIFAFYAQAKVSSTFNKYSKVNNSKGLTGADVAAQLLKNGGVYDVQIERIAGNLTDHYDPRSKTLRLSDSVYSSTSISAIGVAAHETGHAFQHAEGYSPLALRSALIPVSNFGSKLAFPLVIIGLLCTRFSGNFGMILMYMGIIVFSFAVACTLITLPVEFGASRKAIQMLSDQRILNDEEIIPAKKVLSAAAMTYVASAAMALLQLLRLVILANGNKRRG